MKQLQCIFILVVLPFSLLAQANLQWVTQFGSTNNDKIVGMQISKNKNLYTTGVFSGLVDFDPGAGTNSLTSYIATDIFVAKYDSNGNFIWVRQIESHGWFIGGLVRSIEIDDDENIYLTGVFDEDLYMGTGASSLHLFSIDGSNFIIKLSKEGDFIWAKQLNHSKCDLRVFNAHQSSLYFTGKVIDTLDVAPGIDVVNLISQGYYDSFILKLDSSGSFIWVKQIKGMGDDLPMIPFADSIGNIYSCGYFTDSADFDPNLGVFSLDAQFGNAYLLKLDSNGHFIWAKNYGTPLAGGVAYGGGVAMDKNQNLYLSGYFQGTLDFNPGGGVDTIISKGQLDIFICQLDSVGNLKWVKSMGSKKDDKPSRPIIDSKGNVYIPGVFQDTMDVDPGIGIHNLYCNITFFAYAVGFISKLDSSGNFIWAQQFGFDNNSAIGLILDKNDNLYGYGYFSKTVDFDGTDAVYNLTSTGVDDAIIFKMTSWPTNIPPLPTTDGVSLYPNPSNQSSILQFTSQQQFPYQVSIYSITGSLVKNRNGVAIIGENKITLDIENLPPSMYFVTIILDNQKVNTLKLIKY